MSDHIKYVYEVHAHKINKNYESIVLTNWLDSFSTLEEAWNYIYWAEVEYKNKYFKFYVQVALDR